MRGVFLPWGRRACLEAGNVSPQTKLLPEVFGDELVWRVHGACPGVLSTVAPNRHSLVVLPKAALEEFSFRF